MKERLDVLLVKRNLAESREKAKAIIMSGNVFVEGQRGKHVPGRSQYRSSGAYTSVCKQRRLEIRKSDRKF